MSAIDDQIIEALNKLGRSADEVAENLYVMGYSGECKKAHNCPLANYLKDRIAGVNHVSMSITRYSYDYRNPVEFDLPAISEFVLRFDVHKYPKLEA
jgi:hypothetical protein